MFKKTIASAFLVFFSSIGILMGDDKIIKGKDEEKTPENKWYDTVNISGYVDVYYNYTMNNRQGELRIHPEHFTHTTNNLL